MGYINLGESVRYLKGVGPKNVVKFEKMGINTIQDLLEHYPRSYEDRRKLRKINEFVNGEHVVFIAKIIKPIKEKRIRKSLNIMFFYVSDDTEECQITIFNQAYLKDKLVLGASYAFYGKVEITNGRFEMQNPIIVPDYDVDKIMGIYPIYSLTHGITNNYIYTLTKSVLDTGVMLPETIDADIRKKCNLVELNYAVNTIHSPNDFRTIEYARRRIIFEELFFLQLALQSIKKRNKAEARGISFTDTDYSDFIKLLPFNLTGAQMRAIDEIRQDMQSTTPMNRLVQGDVGSGKTMVAAIAMYIAVKNGYQAAMMAPTAILAIQHKEELTKYFSKLNIRVEVITSSTTAKAKKQIIQDLKNRNIDILIGTHAIIEDNIEFNNLGIIITDEQHRFGVKQRMKLSSKGNNVDVIVMTATPIPRTLALMVYSDLDMSIIDELPPRKKTNKNICCR